MLKNYIKIAIRNLQRHKSYSIISIAGLAVSIAACFLIVQYVSFELSYDRFHEHADDLYRLTNDRYQNGELTQHGVITYPSVPKQMKADYPEILDYTRLVQFNRLYLKKDDLGFDESIVFADSAFFSMFTFPLLTGDAKTALARPYSLLLSESAAEKYFGSAWQQQGVVGETFTIDHRFDLTVTGVFKDIPPNSHFSFDILVSYKTLGLEIGSENEDSWTNSNYMAYFQLVPGTNVKELEEKLLDFSERYFRGTEVTNSIERFYLQPLKAIHLHSDYEYETWTHGSDTAVKGLVLIAGFILIIAWVNYINLSTARSMVRAKEVAMRKVVGAGKTQLIKQFLFESVLFNMIGFGSALVMVEFLQKSFHDLLGIHLSGTFLTSDVGMLFFGVFITGTFATGLYPAMLHSSFRPIQALTGKTQRIGRGQTIRKGLVVFQFALSSALIAGTYTVFSQIDFMLNKELGIKIDQTLVIEGPRLTSWDSTYFDHINSFKAEIQRDPSIGNVTTSLRLPGNRIGRVFNIQRRSGDPEKRFTTSQLGVDHEFFQTFEMKILAGRGFSSSDHNLSFNAVKSIVLNATAANHLGFARPEDAIGEVLSYWNKDWRIIGVVTDHHQQSLRVPVEPIVFMPLYSTSNYFFAKVGPENLPNTLAMVKSKYLEFFPGNAFSYFFLDESFNEQYQADQKFGEIFSLFAVLGVLLACLGLFGLASFMASQKTKEIGVRKVLGATVGNVVSLLTGQFIKLVVFANFFAWPIAYFAIDDWLKGYAYRIELGPGIFLAAGLSTLLVAVFTVSIQAVRAATANPVESLRYE